MITVTDSQVVVDVEDLAIVLGTLRWTSVLYPPEVQMAAGHLYGALIRAGQHFDGENLEDEG